MYADRHSLFQNRLGKCDELNEDLPQLASIRRALAST